MTDIYKTIADEHLQKDELVVVIVGSIIFSVVAAAGVDDVTRLGHISSIRVQ